MGASSWAAVGAVAVLLAAGCLGPGDVDTATVRRDVERAAQPYLQDALLDPEAPFDPARHIGSMNLREVAYHNGHQDNRSADALPPGALYTEVAVTDHWVYLARSSDDGSYGGMSILAVEGEAGGVRLRLVGSIAGQPAGDVEVSDDEAYVFLATQRNSIEMMARGAVQDDGAGALPRGVMVVDVRDKGAPRLESFLPVPYNGAHTVTYHRHVDGEEYLLVCTYDLTTSILPAQALPAAPLPAGVVAATQRLEVYRIVRSMVDEVPMQLVRVATHQAVEPEPRSDRWVMPHDAIVSQHPLTGQTLVWLAYWDRGVRVLDFSDPSSGSLPELGAFTDFSPSAYNAIHQVRPSDALVAGRAIVVAEPELVSAPEETGQITFLDASDPTRPAKAAPGSHWRLPAPGLGVRSLEFSPHNFDTFGGRMVLAHYHGGLWVVDFSSPAALEDPRSVGFTFDTRERPDNPRPKPYFWTAAAHGGLLWAVDEGTGLYVYEYTGP